MDFNTFNEIKEDRFLKANEKYFYMLILNYAREKGYAFPSYEQLMKDMGTTDRKTISNLIKKLDQNGYISYVKGNSIKKANEYYPLKYVTSGQIITSSENLTSGEITTSTSSETLTSTSGETLTPTNNITKNKTIYMSLKFIDDVIDKVKITQEQYETLVKKFNKELVHKNIIALDNYIANGKGSKYKDHYRALNTWCSKEKINDKSVGGLEKTQQGYAALEHLKGGMEFD